MADFTGKKNKLLPITALAPMGASGIRDISTSYWFGPLQPINPVSPTGFRPRQYGYQPGANIMWQPKADEPIGYDVLRELADSWDILRFVLTNELDRICCLEWEIRNIVEPGSLKGESAEKNMKDPQIKLLKSFFRKPDGFHSWKSWLRMVCEDMLVIDAVALWTARDQDGKIATIHPIASDTINRMLTDQGVTPPPDSVAYQQVLYGMPVWDFTTNDLLFAMRNERTNKRYGFSPVEQIIRTICFGLRRQEWQISEYTTGNVPEALVFLPSDMPIDRLKEVQDWFDSILSGDLNERRKIRFLPGYGSGDNAKPNIIFPKEPLLKDELDIWLAQLVCYCIGVSAQPFLKMMNRASAEQAQETSEEEGLKPYAVFIKDIMDDLIQEKMGFPDKEFVWSQAKSLDPVKQATADNIYVGKVRTVNETRKNLGEDPRPEPEADMLGTFTPTGFVPIGQTASPYGAEGGGENGDVPTSPNSAASPEPKEPVTSTNSPKPKGMPNFGKLRKSVGGVVSDVVLLAKDKAWINTTEPSTGDECAVYCDPAGFEIKKGDSIWWQGANCYWSPAGGTQKDIVLDKIGYSGVGKPESNGHLIPTK
jgi:hypothetical protein